MSEGEWVIDDYLEKLYPRGSERLADHFATSSRDNIQDSDVSDELLYESYVFMAEIVNSYGGQFLPIFERLHSEIEIRKEKQFLLNTATKVAKANDLVQS